MVPKDKGWGMSNLGYGKNPCFITLLICHLFVSPNLVNLFNAQLVVEELWLRAFIAEVVVVVGGCQPYPISHSTHVCPFFSLTHSPWSVHSLTTILGLLVPHAQVLDEFGLTQAFCSSPRVAEHPLTANSRPLHCCAFSRRGIASRFCLLHVFWFAVVPNS